jgi:hypothetical protein
MFFFRNSLSDQRLLVKTLALICCVRLGLWLLPFRVIKERVAKITSRATSNSTHPQPQDSEVVRRVASSVRRASRYVPAASCLTQALATQILLARRGQISSLQIGVTKSDGEFKAHAWVESEGKIIIGQVRGLRNYTVLNHLEEVSQ